MKVLQLIITFGLENDRTIENWVSRMAKKSNYAIIDLRIVRSLMENHSKKPVTEKAMLHEVVKNVRFFLKKNLNVIVFGDNFSEKWRKGLLSRAKRPFSLTGILPFVITSHPQQLRYLLRDKTPHEARRIAEQYHAYWENYHKLGNEHFNLWG